MATDVQACSGDNLTKQGVAQSEDRDLDPRFGDFEESIGPVEDLEEVQLEEKDSTRVVKVDKNLETTTKQKLVEFLKKNREVFPWSHKDMVGIDPAVISHVLNID